MADLLLFLQLCRLSNVCTRENTQAWYIYLQAEYTAWAASKAAASHVQLV